MLKRTDIHVTREEIGEAGLVLRGHAMCAASELLYRNAIQSAIFDVVGSIENSIRTRIMQKIYGDILDQVSEAKRKILTKLSFSPGASDSDCELASEELGKIVAMLSSEIRGVE